MRAHRSLTRTDVLQYPPEKIALMIASEFLRARERSGHASVAKGCFERARELMGILETISFEEKAALRLKVVYENCAEDRLLSPEGLAPEIVRQKGQAYAEAFERASEEMKHA